MTSILSVSAATAAYAVEPIKPAQRVNGGHLMDAAIKDWAEQALQADDPRQRALVNLVRPPALALYLLTARQPPSGPQTSRQQAEAAYLSTMAMALPELADEDGGATAISGLDGGTDRNTPLDDGNPTAARPTNDGQSPDNALPDGLADVVFLPRV
jgi:hypothetical protein